MKKIKILVKWQTTKYNMKYRSKITNILIKTRNASIICY